MPASTIPTASPARPELGGPVAVVQTWQEQAQIRIEDGIATVETSDSLTLLPFIPNVVMHRGHGDPGGNWNVDGNGLPNLMRGSGGHNILVGYEGGDRILGEEGSDFLAGGLGDDDLIGGAGDDIVWGGQGNDRIMGYEGVDTLNGDRGKDVITGGADNDVLNGGQAADSINGDEGDDLIRGGAGGDTLIGGMGADTIWGDRGDDVLVGGLETLDPSSEPDRFVFAKAFGRDTIRGFTWGDSDEQRDRVVIALDINGVSVNSAGSLWDSAQDTDAGVQISIGNNSILLEGWKTAELSKDIFSLLVT